MPSSRLSSLLSGSFDENVPPQSSDQDPNSKRSAPSDLIYDWFFGSTAKRACRTRVDPQVSTPDMVDLTGDDIQVEARVSTAAQRCVCGKSCINDNNTVYCSSGHCPVNGYHRACVGLANKEKYPDVSNWRCSSCRVPATKAPLTPQLPLPSSQSSQHGDNSTTRLTAALTLTAPGAPPEPPLHPEQLAVLNSIEEGGNVFYTGSGGVGKSTVLKAFVQSLRAQGKQVDITAPSGIAAIAIGGVTIFSYAGWNPDSFKDGMDKLLTKALGKNIRRRLCKTDVLVIDEISMVESDTLTRLDAVMRSVRNGYRPERGETRQSQHSARLAFGGVQIVVTGDFCQLPPIKPFQFCITCGGSEMEGYRDRDGVPKKCTKCKKVCEDKDKWAFKSPAWEAADFQYFELTKIHRQSDVKFISILHKCRYGLKLQQQEQQLLLQKRKIDGTVKLLPQKTEVNRINQDKLTRLPGTSRKYECLDFFQFRNEKEPELQSKGKPLYPGRLDGPLVALKDHRFEENLELKYGMRVILLVNIDLGFKLVNGAQGTIMGFEKYNPNTTYVQRPSEPETGRRSNKAFDDMAEMAALKEGQIHKFMKNAQVQEFPIVKFDCGETRAIAPFCQINELGSEKPYSLLGRTAIPLLAAWAITIHKSQGMTLEKVSVDLGNSFQREMGYVALSRARSLEGLEVIRLPKGASVGMDKEVLNFLQTNIWNMKTTANQ